MKWFLVFVLVMGIGYPPASMSDTPQGKLLARRAAIVDVYRNMHSRGLTKWSIASEDFTDDSKYVITVDAQ